MKSFVTNSLSETVDLGRTFAASLRPGDVVALMGDLGTGKTQFVIGVCDGLGVRCRVTSPTFTLVNEYPAPFGLVVHIDLYRITSRSELPEIGIESYFHEGCICLIEWAEVALHLLPASVYCARLDFGSVANERVIELGELERTAA
jgi:tRNA threonylcarbamoyladenosine biosynthesis protein TsaE